MSTVPTTTIALTAFFLGAVTPVFFAKLRVIPIWLSLQALALGGFVLAQERDLHAVITGLEILLLRGVVVPWILRRYLAQHESVGDIDTMPSNLFAWGIAVALLIVAFRFGDGASTDLRALSLGTVASVLTMAYLILSTNREPLAQLVALLFMENAVMLFETLLPHPWPLPVHGLLALLYVGFPAIGLWLMQGATDSPTTATEDAQ